ncbi:MAG: head-tail connector protein [Victivallales bacterium]|nr:head-tail connector protein [Victivallales bacterium]
MKIKGREVSTYQRIFDEAYNETSSWRVTWRDLKDYILPYAGRPLVDSSASLANAGQRKDQKIINSSATYDMNILASGLMSGLTPQSRSWFNLTLADKNLASYRPVKEWLYLVRNKLEDTFQRSNLYSALHTLYRECQVFGTGAMMILEGSRTMIRCRPYTIGEYYITLDDLYQPCGMMRKISMSAYQIVSQFGEDNVSESVKSAFNNKSMNRFNVYNIIQPTNYFDSRVAKDDIVYESVYWEENGGDDFLEISVYDMIPFVAPRWDISGCEIYGHGVGETILGDVKQLQTMEIDYNRALKKAYNPPLQAPDSLKGTRHMNVPGGITYFSRQEGPNSISSLYNVNLNFEQLAYKIDKVEQRINRNSYAELFLALFMNDPHRMTATEVVQRHEDKLMVLGPVIERFQSELLDILISRTYKILDKYNQLPPPPPDLEGTPIQIQYISILAQAQKMVGRAAIERTAQFVGQLAQFNPDAVLKFNTNQAIEEYSNIMNAPPNVINSDEEVAAAKQAIAMQQQQAQQQAQQKELVDEAKTLSDTKVGANENALEKIIKSA